MKLWPTETCVSQLGGDLQDLVIINKSTVSPNLKRIRSDAMTLTIGSDTFGVLI